MIRLKWAGCAWLALVGAAVALPAHAGDPIQCIDEDVFQAPAQAPAPVLAPSGTARAVYEGATPPGLDPSRPVLVFAHGLHGSADGWFGDTQYYGRNDMYDTAYANGYKTFFVDMDVPGGEAFTSIDNGLLLRDQIGWITSYWGVSSVNVVAHSKGGPDANVAAIFGAPIDSIVSLSGANYGSPLADLAQTSWLVWLADLLGFNDAGTKFMQTGCMNLVRNYLDSKPRNNSLSFYTTAGTGWGPLLSALEFGGLYLYAACPGAGENDGVVCVDHAKHPLARDASGNSDGQHRIVWDLNGPDYEVDHDKIRRGNGFFDFFWFWEPDDCYVPIFDAIEPYVGQFNAARASAGMAASPPPAAVTPAGSTYLANSLIRGGPLQAARNTIAFPVEEQVTRLTLRVMLDSASSHVSLRSPNGAVVRHLPLARPSGDHIMRGSYITGIDLTDVPPGQWELVVNARGAGAYALLAHFESATALELVTEPAAQGQRLNWHLSGNVDEVNTHVLPRRISTHQASRDLTAVSVAGVGRSGVSLPGDGVYNLAVTLSGQTPAGYPFERSVVLSHASQTSAAPGLPAACQ